MRVRWSYNGKLVGSMNFKEFHDSATSLYVHLLIEQYKKGYDIVGRINRPHNKIVVMTDSKNIWGVQICQ